MSQGWRQLNMYENFNNGPAHTYWYIPVAPDPCDLFITQITNEDTFNIGGKHIFRDHISGPFPTLKAAKAAYLILTAAQ